MLSDHFLSCPSCPLCLSVIFVYVAKRLDGSKCHLYGGSRPHCVRLGPPPHQKKGAQPPQFSAHVCCGQTAGWIKMPLGTEVGLSPGHIVLDGDPAPLPKRGAQQPPVFSPCLLRPNGWMDQDVTWCGGSPRPRPHCVRWGPSSPHGKGHSSRSHFTAHVHCGQMVSYLSNC